MWTKPCWSGTPIVGHEAVDETCQRNGPSAQHHHFASRGGHPNAMLQGVGDRDEPVQDHIDEGAVGADRREEQDSCPDAAALRVSGHPGGKDS